MYNSCDLDMYMKRIYLAKFCNYSMRTTNVNINNILYYNNGLLVVI